MTHTNPDPLHIVNQYLPLNCQPAESTTIAPDKQKVKKVTGIPQS